MRGSDYLATVTTTLYPNMTPHGCVYLQFMFLTGPLYLLANAYVLAGLVPGLAYFKSLFFHFKARVLHSPILINTEYALTCIEPVICDFGDLFNSSRIIGYINTLIGLTSPSTNPTTSNLGTAASTSTTVNNSTPTLPQWMTSKIPSCPSNYNVYISIDALRLHIDIREIDTKSSLGSTSVPKEKSNLFKFRRNQDKVLVIGVSQPDENPTVPPLRVVKCLSLGLAYGRFVNANDITELVSNPGPLPSDEATVLLPEASIFVTKTHWSPRAFQFADLNAVTDRDRFVFFTVVCDLLLESLAEPVRLGCVCRAKIFQKDISYWIPAPRKPCSEDYKLTLVELTDESKSWIIMNRFSLLSVSSNFSDVIHSLCSSQTVDQIPKPPSPINKDSGPVKDDATSAATDPGDDGTDDDEPLMSGNGGEDLKIITDDDVFVAWGNLVTEWREWNKGSGKNSLSLPPYPSAQTIVTRSGAECLPDGALGRRMRQLVRRGIPDSLRPEIWQKMAGYQATDQGLGEVYRILLTKPCQFDADIQRDLTRTLPAHNFFQDKSGQEVLFQLTRTYALYDEPVGYCQGISFIAAALLLHLPEEQAFCLLVKIMSNYGIRTIFLNNCEGLFRCLYQFERLLEDQLPDVSRVFSDLGIKPHMYASQWFLTLFTAKFPLSFVFRIFDIFLAEGLLFIFKVMITFLKISRSSLLGLDFEGTLKYFRITLPKRFRSSEACDEFISTACSAKASSTYWHTRITILVITCLLGNLLNEQFLRLDGSVLRIVCLDWVSKVRGKQLNRYGLDFEKQREADAKENSESAALLREVKRLREECGRLDKENSDLAENLMTHKTDMQSTIDRLEDEVENLRQELTNTQHELKEKEEECTLLERDSSRVKEMFREALNKDKDQVTLISEYKTINANLSARLDMELAASAQNAVPQKLSQIVVDAVLACNGDCRRVLDERSPGWSSQPACIASNGGDMEELETLRNRVRELELELAHNKVSLVDAVCARQELSHQLVRTTAELDELKAQAEAAIGYNARQWLAKKWTTVSSRANGNSSNPPAAAASSQSSNIGGSNHFGSTFADSSTLN
ncbi:hypothetical protein ACTXT7_013600 [Hymenolepis weldensis]